MIGCGGAAAGNVRSPAPDDQPLLGDIVPDQSDPEASPAPGADEPNIAQLATEVRVTPPLDQTANCKPAKPYGVSCRVFGSCGGPMNGVAGPMARPTGVDPRCDMTLSMLQH
ncbi:MAG TPA: hypothetical protein VK601_30955 [Kofleriaceae bacterium]|nr:hypothetical protein [Kofleriaceae bacterium]